MSWHLRQLMEQQPSDFFGRRYYGVAPGIVTNNKDPEGLGRVKVYLPWFHEDDDESNWSRVAQRMGGSAMGWWILPEIDDEVLVGFIHGDIRTPIILGGLYNGVDRPPTCGYGGDHNFNRNGRNSMRFWRTRGGHLLLFDDDPNPTGMLLRSNNGNRVEFRTPQKKLLIMSQGDVVFQANRHMEFTAGDHIQATAKSGDIFVEACGGDIFWGAASEITFKCADLTFAGLSGSGIGMQTPTIQFAGTPTGSPGNELKSDMDKTTFSGDQFVVNMGQGKMKFQQKVEVQSATGVVSATGPLQLKAAAKFQCKGEAGVRIDGGAGDAALSGRKVYLN